MNKTIAICILIVSIGTIICVSTVKPAWIDDDNSFLRAFVGNDLLNILAVIAAITLASASQIHLKFNEMEERAGKRIFKKARSEVTSSAFWLIGLFVGAIALVFVKSFVTEYPSVIALVNGLALWILLFNVLILYDITAGIFSIPPDIK